MHEYFYLTFLPLWNETLARSYASQKKGFQAKPIWSGIVLFAVINWLIAVREDGG